MSPHRKKKTPSLNLFFAIASWLLVIGTAGAQTGNIPDSVSVAFYDTLKVRAEKNRLTRLLYDLVIVDKAGSSPLRENMGSTKPFSQYDGLTIRKCEIIRLNAFGTDINDPQYYDPSGVEKFLNSTYFKSRYFVLKKYLLFAEGDTVSSLTMADNERLLRDLTFIEDVRIEVIPVDEKIADVVVIIRETYPFGFDVSLSDFTSGKVMLFNRNFGGFGHELDISVPYRFDEYPYPGIGAKYAVRNIAHSFSNLIMDFSDGLGTTAAGGAFSRSFVSSETKYAWSASVRMIRTREDLDTMMTPEPLHYTYQDYWAARSFMLDRDRVTRLIISARFVNNNVFTRPEIDPYSYYRLQRYRLYMGSVALSTQKFINTSLIYSYGRTENIPYGYLLEFDAGSEFNEFKHRSYVGLKASYGNIFDGFGYLYAGIGFSTFYNDGQTEQGMLQSTIRYFTPLIQTGNSRVRAFLNIYYMRGFNRYTDEALFLKSSSLLRGFSNDSINGNNRIVVSVEPVLFINKPFYGFRFAVFAFADAGMIYNGTLDKGDYHNAVAAGFGVRVRNDLLVFNTIQLRFGFYPGAPPYSETSWASVDGLVKLRPPGFEPEPPGVTLFR